MTASVAEESVIRKIEGLLRQAMNEGCTPEEAEAFQERADLLMAKYRLDQALLNVNRDIIRKREVIVRDYAQISFQDIDPVWRGDVYQLRACRENIFRHCGLKIGTDWQTLTAVGFEDDLYYAEMLWTSVFRHLIETLFPVWKSGRTFDANVFALKNAGMSWPQVREAGLAKSARDFNGPLTEKNAGSKLRTAYKREAARRGIVVPPGKHQPINYAWWRKSFVDSYFSQLRNRLHEMKKKGDEGTSEEGALALRSEDDRLNEKLWELFPDLNPEEIQKCIDKMNKKEAERLASMTEAEKDKERKEAERYRSKIKYKYYDERGWSAGHAAANEVNLTADKTVGTGRAGEIE